VIRHENNWNLLKMGILPLPPLLAYTYIAVKFRFRSSINVWLTESCLYNRFCIERSPKWGFGLMFRVGAKTFSGKVYLSLELHVLSHLWSRSHAPCSCILYGYSHLAYTAKIWASLGLTSSPNRSRRKSSVPEGTLWTFDHHMESFCDVTHGL